MKFFPKTNVVVPLDFSDESLAALTTALDLVDAPQHIAVVHVLQDLSPLEAGEVWGVVDPQTRIATAKEALVNRLGDKYGPVQIEVLLGDPAAAIASFAQDQKAQLIVLPSHGRTGISRLLIGSTAERVVRLAHCPVLVLRK